MSTTVCFFYLFGRDCILIIKSYIHDNKKTSSFYHSVILTINNLGIRLKISGKSRSRSNDADSQVLTIVPGTSGQTVIFRRNQLNNLSVFVF